MEKNLEAKRDQNGPIPKKNWGFQTVIGEILVKSCESGKRMSRLDFFTNVSSVTTNTMYFTNQY